MAMKEAARKAKIKKRRQSLEILPEGRTWKTKKKADDFIERWDKYCPGVELPIVFFYVDDPGEYKQMPQAPPPPAHRCVLFDLARPVKGESIALEASTIGCSGGKRYFGGALTR